MGKLEELRRTALGNIDESMGGGRAGGEAMHRDSPPGPKPVPTRLQGLIRSSNAAEIPVEIIGPDPSQPREEFDEESLGRLAESLKARGQLQPIRVRWDEGQGKYVIICGERRWKAAGIAGLPTLSCIIVDRPLEAAELLAIQLVENALREDLRPIEQARAYRSLMELNGWSGNQLAKELSIAQPCVVRALALLDLPPEVQDRVEQGTLSPATAYEVSKLPDSRAQTEVAARVVDENMTRAEAIEVVRRAAGTTPQSGKGRGVGARAKSRKVTSRSFRVAGCKLVIENRRGLDDRLIEAALEEALAQVRAARPDREEAA